MCTGSESVGREQVRSRKCMGREKVSREKTNTRSNLAKWDPALINKSTNCLVGLAISYTIKHGPLANGY